MENEILNIVQGIEDDHVNGLGAANRRRHVQKISSLVATASGAAQTQTVEHKIRYGKLVNRKYQIVEKVITGSNTVVSINENIKQEYNEVVGIFATCSDLDVAKATTMVLRHKGVEVLPEGFDLNLILDRENVANDDFTFPVQLEGKTAKIDGSLYVGSPAGLPTYPVSVKIYFVCKDDKTTQR